MRRGGKTFLSVSHGPDPSCQYMERITQASKHDELKEAETTTSQAIMLIMLFVSKYFVIHSCIACSIRVSSQNLITFDYLLPHTLRVSRGRSMQQLFSARSTVLLCWAGLLAGRRTRQPGDWGSLGCGIRSGTGLAARGFSRLQFQACTSDSAGSVVRGRASSASSTVLRAPRPARPRTERRCHAATCAVVPAPPPLICRAPRAS